MEKIIPVTVPPRPATRCRKELTMKKKTLQNSIILTVVILLILCLVALAFLSGRVSRIPEGTVGNTAGNLNNDGLFCEYDGTVYFSNARDNGRLYAMNADESGVRRLSELKVRNILAGGRYLFYYQLGEPASSGPGNIVTVKTFNRSNLKGKQDTSLTWDSVVCAQLVDNELYLMTEGANGAPFYKMKTDGSDAVTLADYQVNPACAVDGTIYYNGTQNNHYLYGFDTASGAVYEIWRGNLWYPVLDGGYVYYLDVAENYRLCRYSLSGDMVEVLTNDRADCFNVGGGYIYYQKNGDTPQLKCMRTDGTDVKVIAEGNYTKINMTSQYVYFQEFGMESSLYHSYLGSDSYSEFVPQSDAP